MAVAASMRRLLDRRLGAMEDCAAIVARSLAGAGASPHVALMFGRVRAGPVPGEGWLPRR